MKAVVVGATGFLGAHVLQALAHSPVDSVVAVARTKRPLATPPGLPAEFVGGDSTDFSFVRRLMQEERPDLWVDLSIFDAGTMQNLANAWRETPTVRRFVAAGSIAEYGFQTSPRCPVKEDASLAGEGPYAKGKIQACQIAREAASQHGFPICWTVIPQLWGEHDQHGRDCIVPYRLARNLPVVLRGNGRTAMPDGWAGTVAAAMVHLATTCDAPPIRVNVAGPQILTPLQFVHWTASVMGTRPRLLHLPHKLVSKFESETGKRYRNPFADGDFCMDLSVLQSTGFLPSATARQGAEATARWHHEQQSRPDPAFDLADELQKQLSLDL